MGLRVGNGAETMEQGRPDRRHHLDLTAVPIPITSAWTIVANNVDRRHFVSWSSLSRNRSTSCCCYCCPVAVPPAKEAPQLPASGFGQSRQPKKYRNYQSVASEVAVTGDRLQGAREPHGPQSHIAPHNPLRCWKGVATYGQSRR